MTKKIMIILILIMIPATMMNIIKDNIYAKVDLDKDNRKVVNIGVAISNLNNNYLAQVKQSLENIQSKNENGVKFTFFDGKDNANTQERNIDGLVNGGYDIFLVNLHDKNGNLVEYTINKVKQINKPLILFNIEPSTIKPTLKSYNKLIIIDNDYIQASIIEGKILINEWNNNRNYIDKNNDKMLQYIMLINENKDPSALNDMKYTILTLNNAGIKTQELASQICILNKSCDISTIQNVFMRFGDKIEAIITNDDSMSMSTVEILQKYGYNKGNPSKYITLVGIDGTPATRELVDKGLMSGTVFQDSNELANTIYAVGMNLVSNRDPLYGVNYAYNETGNTIEMPYIEYKKTIG